MRRLGLLIAVATMALTMLPEPASAQAAQRSAQSDCTRELQRRGLFRLRWLVPGSSDADGEAIDWADEANPDPSRSHDGQEAWARIRQALRGLPARQREAFTLRVLEELDVADTARVMGCSEGSVKTHLSRAREALQRQLEEFR